MADLSASTTTLPPAVGPFGGPGSLWNTMLAEVKQIEESKKKSKDPTVKATAAPAESFLYVVGDDPSRASKEPLIKLLCPWDESGAPAREGEFDYFYCNKWGQSDASIHGWDVAGDAAFADRYTSASRDVFLAAAQIARSVVVVCVDLSQPAEALETLDLWLRRVRDKARATLAKLTEQKHKLPEQLRVRTLKAFQPRDAPPAEKDKVPQHEDAASVEHCYVSVVVCALTSAAFDAVEPEPRRVMLRALRFYAHTNGCSLFTLDAAGGQRAAKDLAALVKGLLLQGPDRKANNKAPLNADPPGPLAIPAGEDSLRTIGAPANTEQLPAAEQREAWRALVARYFPVSGARRADEEARERWQREHRQAQYADTDVEAAVRAQQEQRAAAGPPARLGSGTSRGGDRPSSRGGEKKPAPVGGARPPSSSGGAERPRSSTPRRPATPKQ